MSTLSYYKMMTAGKNLKRQISHAQRVCVERPSSQSCRVAWDQVEEMCATLDMCKMKYEVELKDDMEIELPWEEESRFYDV